MSSSLNLGPPRIYSTKALPVEVSVLCGTFARLSDRDRDLEKRLYTDYRDTSAKTLGPVSTNTRRQSAFPAFFEDLLAAMSLHTAII